MKELRMRRFFVPEINHRILIVPLDHGITMGPIEGITNIRDTVSCIINSDADSLVLHKGNIQCCKDILSKAYNKSVIMHLSASTSLSTNKDRKVLVASVAEAVSMGVDAVSIHINIGNKYDYYMLKEFGVVSDECRKWGVPLLAMMYPRGNHIDERSVEANKLCARIAMELGADIVKLNYTGSKESFEEVIEGVNIPVVMSGGVLKSTLENLFTEIRGAIEAGASGVAIGRNVFQQKNKMQIIKNIKNLLNETAVDACIKEKMMIGVDV